MKTTGKLLMRFLILGLIIAVVACSKDDSGSDSTDPTNPSNQTIDEVLASGGNIPEFPTEISKNDVEGTEQTRNEKFDRKDSLNLDVSLDQRWVCTEKEVDVLGGSGDFPLYNPNASVIWPGNLLQYNSLDKGTPSEIIVKRAGGSITYDLNVGNPNATETVDVIDQGSVNQAMNKIIENNGDINPADFSLEVVAINSKEELAVEMGLKVSTLATKVNTNFSLDSDVSTSSVLVKLRQRYYTMSYVKPTSLEEVFDPSVTSEQLAKFVQPDNPATFISSVTYGRIFYMLYESTASAQDMKATLEGSYKFVGGSASGNASLDRLREYNNLSVKVIAYGGDSEGTLESVGSVFGGENAVENLQEIVNRLAKAGDIRGGKPLSYTVNSLENPSIVVATNLATTYTIKNCEYKGILPPEGYKALLDLYIDDEDGGGIGAIVHIAESNALIFNKMGTKYAWYNGGTGTVKGVFNITDEASPLGVVQLSDVGSGVKWTNNSRIYFFDKSGLRASRFTYNATDPALASSGDAPTTPIGTFVDPIDDPFEVNGGFGDASNFPFAGQGFEAATRVGNSTVAFFGRPGEEYALYSTSSGDWQPVQNSDTWFNGATDQTGPKLFDRVSGVGRILFSASTERWLMVSEDGSEIMEYQGSPTTPRKFEGPWVIN